jgi:hypothetical protein
MSLAGSRGKRGGTTTTGGGQTLESFSIYWRVLRGCDGSLQRLGSSHESDHLKHKI